MESRFYNTLEKTSFDPQNVKDQAGSSGKFIATVEFDLNVLTATADLNSSIQMDQLLAHQHALKEAISTDVAKLQKQHPCGSLDKVLEYSPEYWLKDRPEELVSYLTTICGFSIKKKRDAMLLCKCIEQLYGAKSKVVVFNFILGKIWSVIQFKTAKPFAISTIKVHHLAHTHSSQNS